MKKITIVEDTSQIISEDRIRLTAINQLLKKETSTRMVIDKDSEYKTMCEALGIKICDEIND